MRVAIITHCFAPGGTTTYLLGIVKHLESSGNTIIVAGSPGMMEEQFLKYGVRIIQVPELIDHSSFLYKIYFKILPKKFTSSFTYNSFNKSLIQRLIRKIFQKKESNASEIGVILGNSRSLISKLFPLLKSIIAVYKELQQFKPDIVFTTQLQPTIATLLSRRLMRSNFPVYEFIMGIKDTMDVPAPWFSNRSRFADKQLATSNEIFERLKIIRSSGYITYVGNCIDETTYFIFPDYKKKQLRKQFHQTPSQFVLLNVSSSWIYLPIVKAACQAFIDFYKTTGSGILLIVGPEELEKEINKFQKEIRLYSGQEKIFHLGKITKDLEQIYNLADLFVGVGRSTREAMLCGVPSIVYGNEGHPGIVKPSTVDNIRYFNYSGRGCNRESTPNNLMQEILQIFAMDTSERQELGLWSRDYVLKTESYKSFFDKVKIKIFSGKNTDTIG